MPFSTSSNCGRRRHDDSDPDHRPGGAPISQLGIGSGQEPLGSLLEGQEGPYHIGGQARSQKLRPCKTPPNIRITFWQKDKRIEKDNLLVNTKYLLDGLVEGGILPDDRWDSYLSLGFRYEIDRTNPRIVIQLIEDPSHDQR